MDKISEAKKFNFIVNENKRLTQKLSELSARLEDESEVKKSLEKELQSRENELKNIIHINCQLNEAIPSEDIYSLVASSACERIGADVCMIRLLDEKQKKLVLASCHNFNHELVKKVPEVNIGDGISGKAAKFNSPIGIVDIETDARFKGLAIIKFVRKLGVRSMLAVPVSLKNKVKGVITAYFYKQVKLDDKQMQLLKMFASQIAVHIQEIEQQKKNELTYFDTIKTLVMTLEAKDPYNHGHTERVTKYALEIGKALGLSSDEIKNLRFAALVHDIGKLSIPDFILNKPDKLSSAERLIIELHPIKGGEIIGLLGFLKPIVPLVRHHHERYDGKGYPDKLVKDNIPIMARILACADSFDAMTSDRPYRFRRMTLNEALIELKKHCGSQFDPKIVKLFISIIKQRNRK